MNPVSTWFLDSCESGIGSIESFLQSDKPPPGGGGYDYRAV